MSLTSDIKEQIAKEYIDNGVSSKILAVKYGCSIASVHNYINHYKNGTKMNQKGKSHVKNNQIRQLTNEEKVEIGNKYLKGGVKIVDLAKEYQCSIASVSSYIKLVKKGNTTMSNRGGNYKKGNKIKPIEHETKIKIANEYLKGGVNQKELATKYGCSIGSVHYYINCVKNNLPMHQYGKKIK